MEPRELSAASQPTHRPITIVRVIARLNVGGPAIHTVLLTRGLNDGDFRSTLVTGMHGKEEGDMSYFAHERGVDPVVIPEIGRELSWRDDLVAFFKLVKLMRRLKPEIVHTHTAKAGAVGRVAALFAGVPIRIHTFHGHVFRGYFGALKTRVFLWIERFLARSSAGVVAISERQKHELTRVFRVTDERRCTVIPLGFDLASFEAAERRRGELRRELGRSASEPLVGIVGRLVPIKNHSLFLQAMRKVVQKRPDTALVIVGDGELRRALEDETRALGLADRTHFLGWRRDLDVVYADLDLVALTSINEGTPVALIEGMAAARAVVATDVGGVGDVVENRETGLVVPPDDAELFAAAVLELLEDPSLRERYGRAGRERAVGRYGAGRLVGDVRALYLELLAKHGLSVGLTQGRREGGPSTRAGSGSASILK
jgi:glycosyltransferase involved in cell wall biosynthesis